MTLRCKERQIACETISESIAYRIHQKIPREQLWLDQSDYTFVLSPPSTDIDTSTITHMHRGKEGGFDCIRTWEALVLGCIPIIKSSPMDYLFDNLPVWIVSDWNEINMENALVNKINEMKNRSFDYNKLTLKYWVDLMYSKTL